MRQTNESVKNKKRDPTTQSEEEERQKETEVTLCRIK